MNQKVLSLLCILIGLCAAPLAAQTGLPAVLPDARSWSGMPAETFTAYHVILRPDSLLPEWWAGAPSVIRDPQGTFWMACRMRTARAPRGRRGYEIRILSSRDGVQFQRVASIHREDLPIPGFERPALLLDSTTGKFKLYICGPWKDGPWSILKFDDAVRPDQFDPATVRPVIAPQPPAGERDIAVLEYKDPVICFFNDRYHCYVTGYIRTLERFFHFTSSDGEHWQPYGHPNDSVLPLCGWHDFFIRPSSVLPLGIGYLFVYEGSNVKWHDPVYNIVTGIGFTHDLHHVIDLTPDQPLVQSSTPGAFFTWRYSTWLWVDGEIWVYAEVACPDNTHEIRLFKIPLDGSSPRSFKGK